MNDTAQMLVAEHGGGTFCVMPGRGFENLTAATACTYLVNAGNRIISVILETSMDEPLDDVCDFFVQQIYLAGKPSPQMQEWGLVGARAGFVVAHLALDGVPEWIRDVIQQRIHENTHVIKDHKEQW